MRRYKPRKKPMSEINVVPYIDVMLVLLVIFMITAPMLTQGVSIDLPKASAEVIDDESQEPIIVSVNKKGELFLNIDSKPNQAIQREPLAVKVAAQLQLAKQAGKQRAVLVKGDKSVDYGKVVDVMALLQTAGAAKVGLMTEPPPSIDLSKQLKPIERRG